jgi:site-specific recombinase XerD
MSYLDLEKNNIVTISEIHKAAEKWAGRPADRKQGFSKGSMMRFKSVATGWLYMLGRIKYPEEKTNPSLELVTQYVDYMRDERGFSEKTIYPRISVLRDFVRHLGGHCSLENLDILRIEEILKSKHDVVGLCRRTIQSYASNIRSFLRYLEEKGFCQQGLAESIKLARTYRHESLPSSPSWDDVNQLLKKTEGDSPKNIRDRAIIMILAIYGLRCGEVVKLKLKDLDWKKEILYVRGRKNGNSQEYPLSQTVGDAILRYIKQVRPNTCPCREVFITMKAPHGPLGPSAVFQIVSRLYKGLDVKIKHHGPHSLRHACATRLINEKVSLKEISDYLGHHSLESTRIYAKVDLTSLRKVADFEIGDLI